MERVWIYQANRFIQKEEFDSLRSDLITFVENWKTHGVPLNSKVEILENLFILLKVDENKVAASGCSVDSSVHFLKSIGQKYGIDFFDRMKVAYRSKDGTVCLVNSAEFSELLKNGVLDKETLVFNNLITNSVELSEKWQIPFKDSWHSKIM